MFFFTYLRRELRRRMRQAVVTALGIALGIGLVIGLVITVTALSSGVRSAQGEVLGAMNSSPGATTLAGPRSAASLSSGHSLNRGADRLARPAPGRR